jgi:hypothetical protein
MATSTKKTGKTTARKPVAKKAVAKKTVAKKPAVMSKKPAVKKVVAKKVAAKKTAVVKKARTAIAKASSAPLPKQFAKLGKYMAFCLPTTKDRLRKRAGTPMAELEAFYNFMKPMMIDILTFLQAHPVKAEEQTVEVRNLVYLAKSFMEASMAVELLKEPDESNVWGFEDMTLTDH